MKAPPTIVLLLSVFAVGHSSISNPRPGTYRDQDPECERIVRLVPNVCELPQVREFCLASCTGCGQSSTTSSEPEPTSTETAPRITTPSIWGRPRYTTGEPASTPSATWPTPSTASPHDPACIDYIDNCKALADEGKCSSQHIRDFCKLTCNVCGPSTTTTATGGTCEDQNPKCDSWVHMCQWNDLVRKQCKSTCDACNEAMILTSFLSNEL